MPDVGQDDLCQRAQVRRPARSLSGRRPGASRRPAPQQGHGRCRPPSARGPAKARSSGQRPAACPDPALHHGRNPRQGSRRTRPSTPGSCKVRPGGRLDVVGRQPKLQAARPRSPARSGSSGTAGVISASTASRLIRETSAAQRQARQVRQQMLGDLVSRRRDDRAVLAEPARLRIEGQRRGQPCGHDPSSAASSRQQPPGPAAPALPKVEQSAVLVEDHSPIMPPFAVPARRYRGGCGALLQPAARVRSSASPRRRASMPVRQAVSYRAGPRCRKRPSHGCHCSK